MSQTANTMSKPTQISKLTIPTGPLVNPENIPMVDKTRLLEGPNFCSLPPVDKVGPNEPITECIIRQSVKEKILAIPGFPQPFVPLDPPRCKITPMPGAGLGLIATTDIDIGEDIVIERPLLVITAALPGANVRGCRPTELQQVLTNRLSDERRDDVYALHNCKGYSRPHITGIIDTNGLNIGGLPGYEGMCMGLCNIISRANHR